MKASLPWFVSIHSILKCRDIASVWCVDVSGFLPAVSDRATDIDVSQMVYSVVQHIPLKSDRFTCVCLSWCFSYVFFFSKYHTEFEEGNISLDSYMVLEDAVECSMDSDSLEQLGDNIMKIFELGSWYLCPSFFAFHPVFHPINAVICVP